MVTKTRDNAMQDIVIDMVQRAEALLADPPAQGDRAQALHELEKALRDAWGGDRPYIAHRRGDGHSDRNSRIYRAWLSGNHPGLLARRENLTPRRVLQIINAMRVAARAGIK